MQKPENAKRIKTMKKETGGKENRKPGRDWSADLRQRQKKREGGEKEKREKRERRDEGGTVQQFNSSTGH
jgi:hypothetical protein